MSEAKLSIKVILGSTRPERFSEKPGAWILDILAKRDGVEAELLDLRDYPMPFFNDPVTPSSKKEPYTEPAVAKWTKKIAEADGFIVITPEYNHGYPAVLKNAFDYVSEEWNKKPVAFVAYGSAMGARSVEQLRLVAIELQMAPVRNALPMPWDAVEAGRKSPPAEAFKQYEARAESVIDQLVWWAKALKTARDGA